MSPASAQLMERAEVTDLPVIEFVSPMPGFPSCKEFVLVRLHEEGVLYALTSVDHDGLRFLVVPPDPFFSDYYPEIDDESMALLGVKDTSDLILMLVVTPGDTVGASTANLMAPIVLHEKSRQAVQLILNGTGLPVRAPLLPI